MRKFRIIFLLFSLFFFNLENVFSASTDPLIYANNLEHLGAFRVPAGKFGGTSDNHSFAFGGGVLAYNPENNSLFISGHIYGQLIAEISIPEPVNGHVLSELPATSENLQKLNVASVLQGFSDITEGNRSNIGEDGAVVNASGVRLGGLLKYGDKLIGTSFGFYDASGSVKLSHFTSSTNLSQAGDFQGMFKVDTSAGINPGFLDGFMTHIPENLQVELGGPVLTGNGGLSIISRTSSGPAAFSFDPNDLGATTALANELLYYPLSNSTLDSFKDPQTTANPYFNLTTKLAGMVMVPGSRSVLYFGYHGLGPYSYGNPTSDPSQAGIDCQNDGAICYYDPTGMGAKGPHAYPYIYQIWAYDANDLINVKNGNLQPWEVLPYATWKLPYKLVPTSIFGGSAAYDPNTQRLFVVEPSGERSGCCSSLPLIHVFKVNLNAPVESEYALSGQVMLLDGTLVINNGLEDLQISTAERTITKEFSFFNKIQTGGNYNITISQQPTNQTCSVINSSGSIDANSDVENIIISCEGEGNVDQFPTISLVNPITSISKNKNPQFSFLSDSSGTISYQGGCLSNETQVASSEEKTLLLNSLVAGVYSNCAISVTDSQNNVSEPLRIPEFTITYSSDNDLDKDVDIFDYNILLSNFGAQSDCQNQADTNEDCEINIFDYNSLLGDFGKSF